MVLIMSGKIEKVPLVAADFLELNGKISGVSGNFWEAVVW